MIAATIIVLREVIEAALVIGIVLAATRGVPLRGRFVAGGVVLGIVGALVVAGFAGRIAGALEGMGQEVFNAAVLLTATAMLGWHNVWMKRHGADLARDMKSVGHAVSTGRQSLLVLLTVVGLAVLREGSEVVLFLYGIAAGGTGSAPMLAGSLLGLAGGVTIGALLYFGLLKIPARHLFSVTGWLLLLLAAGMAAQAAGFLVQAGKLPALVEPLWDTSALLPEHGIVGQVLHALMGYVDRPSGMQVVFFLTVALGIGVLMTRIDRTPPRLATTGAAVAALLAAGVLAEYAHSLEDDGDDALELGLLMEKQFSSTVLTGNLLFERAFADGAGTGMEYAARYRWRLSEAVEPGIELYGELGDWGANGSLDQHEHQLGPALLGKLHSGEHSAFKYETAVLFGLTHDSPDATLRMQLEY